MARPIDIGRVAGHRGNRGAITVRVASGDASRWTALRRVIVSRDGSEAGTERAVVAARAYRDRLVLELEGIDDANDAARLRGAVVRAPGDEVPELPEGRYWIADLIGIEVLDEDGERIGAVRDVIEAGGSGGADVLVVLSKDGEETLVPWVEPIVREVDVASGRIVVRLPEGLRGLNPPERR